MCFSATASFITGGALCVTGLVSIKKSRGSSMLPFSAIPLLFGIQQITEGFVWQSVGECFPLYWTGPSAFVFLVFAQVIWPFWVPFSLLIPEPLKKRRQFLRVLLLLGFVPAVFSLHGLSNFPITVAAEEGHIHYLAGFPGGPLKLISAIYILATILPTFISSIPKMRLLGSVLLLSFLVTLFFYREYLISVWCFFAAVVSIMVLYVLHRTEHQPSLEK